MTLKSFIRSFGKTHGLLTVLSDPFSYANTKSILTPSKRGSIRKSKYWFRVSVDAFGSYIFPLIVLLNHDLNFFNRFKLS